jgi:hypothetical protein
MGSRAGNDMINKSNQNLNSGGITPRAKPLPFWRKPSVQELGICLLLILMTIGVRLGTAKSAVYGDASHKWLKCRLISSIDRDVDVEDVRAAWHWNHHTTRWALMVPVICIQSVLGDSPKYYYVFPTFVWCIGILSTYAIGCQIRSRMGGLACALTVLLFPEACFYGTQFMPDIPEAMWLLTALALLIRWQLRRGWVALTLSAVAFFIAYGSKITVLYFLPAVAIWLYLESKKWKMPFCYLSVLFVLFWIETVIYYTLSGEPLGRIGLLAHTTHMQNAVSGRALSTTIVPGPQGFTFIHWLFAWKDYLGYRFTMQFAIFCPLLVSIIVLSLRIRKLYLLAIVTISGFVFHTWSVVSVNPFCLPQMRISRYQTQLALLGIVLVVLFLLMIPMPFRTQLARAKRPLSSRLISWLPRRLDRVASKSSCHNTTTRPLMICYVSRVLVICLIISFLMVDFILLRNFLPLKANSCWQFWRDVAYMAPHLQKEPSFAILLSEKKQSEGVSPSQLAQRVLAMFAPLAVSLEINHDSPTCRLRDKEGNYIRVYGPWDGQCVLPLAEYQKKCRMWQPSGKEVLIEHDRIH